MLLKSFIKHHMKFVDGRFTENNLNCFEYELSVAKAIRSELIIEFYKSNIEKYILETISRPARVNEKNELINQAKTTFVIKPANKGYDYNKLISTSYCEHIYIMICENGTLQIIQENNFSNTTLYAYLEEIRNFNFIIEGLKIRVEDKLTSLIAIKRIINKPKFLLENMADRNY